jgi:exodeoxyribonuclease V beta subunit
MSARFDVGAVPLDGIHAIEASAGSGKTHALVGLFMRGLLECGHEVDGVVAVTFTDAATEELAERIVRRLDAARRWFDDARAGADVDGALLESIVVRVGDRRRVRARLGAALASIDRLCVSTLHGYARRALAEGAWRAGDLRDAVPVDGARARAEAARDCLRRWDIEDPDYALRLRRRRATQDAESLARLAAELTAMRPARVLPEDVESAQAAASRAMADAGLAASAQIRDSALEEARALLSGNPALSQAKDTGYTPTRVAAMFDAVRRWRDAPTLPLDAIAAALHPVEIRDAPSSPSGRKLARPRHAVFDLLAPVIDAASAWLRLTSAADLWRAWRTIEAEAARREVQRGEISHDRVIQALHDALAGDDGARIAERLGARHRLILVDEFQDTDALQFSILARVRAGAPGGLVMIGDPKQAIYGFRGGDVHAWQRARSALSAPPARIATNWRSVPALVEAVNVLFSKPDLFDLDFVDYQPAFAAERPRGAGLADPRSASAMVFLVAADDDDPWDAAAAEIARLVRDPAVTLDNVRVRPADCAVLVRRHRDAQAMAEALARLDVPAARVGSADLLEGPAAQAWRQWLAALADPGDRAARRMALAGPAFDADAAALEAQSADPAADAAERARWLAWRDRFEQAGVGAVMTAICGELAPRLLGREDGAALLDALRQLGAWLEREYPGLRDPAVLLARLELACLRGRPDDGEARAAAAVAADAVRVMTVHAAKGLEFPIVFVPHFEPSRTTRNDRPVRVHDADGAVVLDLGSSEREAHLAQAGREAAAEEMRLAYVALTRAAQRCYVGVQPGKMKPGAALSRILGVDALPRKALPTAVPAALAALAAAHPGHIGVRAVATDVHFADATPLAAATVALAPRSVHRVARPGWQLASYSALLRRTGGDESRDHDRWVQPTTVPSGTAVAATVFGECFHAAMERIDPSTRFGVAAERELDRLAARYGLGVADRALLGRLVDAAFDTPLLPALRWRDLDAGRRATELAFGFRLGAGAGREVAAVLRAAGEGALAERVAAGALDRPGLMRGAIDAVFEHADTWHIVDWKTNRVDVAAGADGLAQAIAEHGYDLQALIYQVALHRHLRVRLADSRRTVMPIGRAHYVFVRSALEPGAQAVVATGLSADVVAALDRAFDAGHA